MNYSRFKFRAFVKNTGLLLGVDSFFIDPSRDKITLHFSDNHTKTMKSSDFILEQCIGLKDKNGKLIYEGDIIKQFNNHGRLLRVGYIVYNEKEMKFKIREERCPDWNEKTDDFTFHPLKQMLLVIGNIHENTKLLKDEE